jgi:hypothetical protein
MGFFAKINGVIQNFFQIGGPAGPALKNSSGVIEARNAADAAYVVVRGGMPSGINDLTTKQYVDTLNKPVVVTLQHDGTVALPANSGTAKWYVVTTTGGFAAIGELLWDNGSGSGTVLLVPVMEGRTIFTSVAFTGGAISLAANSFYIWDITTSAWLADAAVNFSGAVRTIKYALANTPATQDSTATLPTGAVVLRAMIDVTTPFSGGTTITVGQAGFLTTFMGTTDSHPTVSNQYEVPQDTVAPVVGVIRTTIAGAPAAGAGFTVIEYAVPDA